METNQYYFSDLYELAIQNWRSGISVIVLILSYVFIFYYMKKHDISIDSEESVRQKAQQEGRYAIAQLYDSSFTWRNNDRERHYCGNYVYEVKGVTYRKSAWFYHNPPEHLMFYWKRNPARAKPESIMGKKHLWIYIVPWIFAVIAYIIFV